MLKCGGYNADLMRDDLREKGWLPVDLARQSGVSHMSVSRFLSGERQTPRMAKRFAEALGFSIRRYMLPASAGQHSSVERVGDDAAVTGVR